MSKNNQNNKEKPDILMSEYAEAAFKASVGISVSKKGRWVNIRLALFGGKAFMTRGRKSMNVQLTSKGVSELIDHLIKARTIQYNEIAQQQTEETPVADDDWSDSK